LKSDLDVRFAESTQIFDFDRLRLQNNRQKRAAYERYAARLWVKRFVFSALVRA
jgi:hypothetical protein